MKGEAEEIADPTGAGNMNFSPRNGGQSAHGWSHLIHALMAEGLSNQMGLIQAQ